MQSGTASITQSGDTTTVRQASQDVSITWQNFDIGAQDTVEFLQPSTSAIAVNRILSTNGSQIFGHLDANGQVWLINPNGVLFGRGAEINVGGLVASTLSVNDPAFSDTTFSFNGGSAGSIVNEGTINAAQGGYVALLGKSSINQGTISAKLGTVALGAGSAITLTFSGTSLVKMQVDQSTLNTVAENGGLIQADGGTVIMSAGAKNALLASVVNNTGVIEARTVENHAGTIELIGGMRAGTVQVGGTLDASAPDGGNGGFVETSAAHVDVASDARVTTFAAAGKTGSWLIDPTDFTVAPSGGDMSGATLSGDLNTTNTTILSSNGASTVTGGGSGGNININDTVAWSANTTLTLTAANNVNVNANMTATGNTAGLVINPATANSGSQGTQAASSSGAFNLNIGNSITLSGTNPSLSIAGWPYTVINSLGAPGSTTGTDLQGVNGNLSGHYALGSNINAAPTSTWNGGAGFTPIGSATPFTGIFNGLGHTISNLTIDLPSTSGVGLFGNASFAVIQNVGLAGGSVIGNDGVGILVGENGGTVLNSFATGSGVSGSSSVGGLVGANLATITNSYSSDRVTGSYAVGGLVGTNEAAIYNSYATGAVTGSSYVGGLVGRSWDFVTNSYATGSVSGTENVGGLVGGNTPGGEVTNSYATGSVSGTENVGGLVGSNLTGYVLNSYATGSVSGASGSSAVGGLVGTNEDGTVGSSFWDITTSGQSTSAGGTGLTTAQMQTASNFSGFNFTSTPGASGNNWVIVDNDGTLNNASGAAGATFPMLASEYSTTINNAHQLQLMAMNVAASYTLGQNIDASATAGASTDVWYGSTFIPIGNSANIFTGSFNGQGYTVNNLTINLPSVNNVGLFGYTGAGALIQNVGLEGGSVSGGGNAGGLVGTNYGAINNSYATGNVSGGGGLVGYNGGSITNSYATGSVTGGGDVGGLLGTNFYGTVNNSYATGSVSGSGTVGGLVGSNNYGTVTNSYATGNVSGGGDIGGLVGSNFGYPSGGSISNSYATGSVTGGSDAGGLVGYNFFGSISNSYVTGNVSGAGDVGGLMGDNENGSISNSYATGRVSGTSGTVGGLVGSMGEGGISNSYATGNVIGGRDVGGLVGEISEGGVTNSYATGSVTGSPNALDVGGLVGYSSEGLVSNSYATGRVSGSGAVGGLEGYSTVAWISNSYATGNVSGVGYVGGLVGENNSPISNSYATGRVTGSASSQYVGGLLGYDQGDFFVTNSFWDITTTGQQTSAGGAGATGLTDTQMRMALSFTGWSIASSGGSGDVWRIYQGNTYPLLVSFLTPLTLGNATVTYNGVAQSGSSIGAPISGVLGSAATGTNAGVYNGYYSNQQGYDITGGTLTINPAALRLSGTRVYDGTTVVAGSVLTATGVAGQTFSVTGAGDPSNLSNKNVQNDSALSSVVGLGLGTSTNGGLASNYTALSTTGSSISITPLALTGVSIASVGSEYGSTVNPGAVALNGVLAADAGLVTATASIVSPLYSTSRHLQAGSYAQTAGPLTGADALDYTFAGAATRYTTPTDNYTVSPVALTVASIAAVSSIYGTPKSAGAVTLKGVITGDKVTSTAGIANSVYSGSHNLDAGSYAQTASLLTGADAKDYSFAGYTTPTHSYTVAPRTLTVTGVTATNKVYNGSAADPLGGKAAIAPLAGDKVTLSGTGAGVFANANVGTGKAVAISGYALSGTDAGNYLLTEPTGLSANITQLASVTWVGGSSGVWSKASNWAGGAIPDYGNVASVTIPSGTTVTYDSGVPGTTTLAALTSSGTLIVAAGDLSTTGNLTTTGYQQSGGKLQVGGTLSINSTGSVTLGNITAHALTVDSHDYAIAQDASSVIDVTGATTLIAGSGTKEYNIALAQSGDIFGGMVSATGLNIDLLDSSAGGLLLGTTTASGTLTEVSRAGAISQASGTAVNVTGTTSLTADNGVTGKSAVDYAITLTQAADKFDGAVTAQGSAITLDDATALTANLDSTGAASLNAAGELVIGGTVGKTLTTVTTGGTHSTTTFDATTVGSSLKVTSTGAVTTATPSTALIVDGAGTKIHNSHVIVNGVVGAEIQ